MRSIAHTIASRTASSASAALSSGGTIYGVLTGGSPTLSPLLPFQLVGGARGRVSWGDPAVTEDDNAPAPDRPGLRPRPRRPAPFSPTAKIPKSTAPLAAP